MTKPLLNNKGFLYIIQKLLKESAPIKVENGLMVSSLQFLFFYIMSDNRSL